MVVLSYAMTPFFFKLHNITAAEFLLLNPGGSTTDSRSWTRPSVSISNNTAALPPILNLALNVLLGSSIIHGKFGDRVGPGSSFFGQANRVLVLFDPTFLLHSEKSHREGVGLDPTHRGNPLPGGIGVPRICFEKEGKVEDFLWTADGTLRRRRIRSSWLLGYPVFSLSAIAFGHAAHLEIYVCIVCCFPMDRSSEFFCEPIEMRMVQQNPSCCVFFVSMNRSSETKILNASDRFLFQRMGNDDRRRHWNSRQFIHRNSPLPTLTCIFDALLRLSIIFCLPLGGVLFVLVFRNKRSISCPALTMVWESESKSILFSKSVTRRIRIHLQSRLTDHVSYGNDTRYSLDNSLKSME